MYKTLSLRCINEYKKRIQIKIQDIETKKIHGVYITYKNKAFAKIWNALIVHDSVVFFECAIQEGLIDHTIKNVKFYDYEYMKENFPEFII